MLASCTCIIIATKSFDFTCLLHTYFKTPAISMTTISGLGGLEYVDKVSGAVVVECQQVYVTRNNGCIDG